MTSTDTGAQVVAMLHELKAERDAARAQVAALVAALVASQRWTTTPPTELGWYWYREWTEDPWSPCEVGNDRQGALSVWVADRWMAVTEMGGEWSAAPVQPPSEEV